MKKEELQTMIDGINADWLANDPTHTFAQKDISTHPPAATPEQMADSRLVDQMAKQLRCGRGEVADKIEKMVAELEAMKATNNVVDS